MKTFIWERIEQLTDNYHPGGGLVIIAESLERAKTLLPNITLPVPDYMTDGGIEEKVFIFPDSGCC